MIFVVVTTLNLDLKELVALLGLLPGASWLLCGCHGFSEVCDSIPDHTPLLFLKHFSCFSTIFCALPSVYFCLRSATAAKPYNIIHRRL